MQAKTHVLVGAPVGTGAAECIQYVRPPDFGDQSQISLSVIASKIDLHTAYSLAPQLVRAPLPNNYELVFSPEYGTHVLALAPSAQVVLDSFAKPHTLAHPYDLGVTEAEASEIALRLAAHGVLVQPAMRQAPPLTTDTLSAWLHITNACNLACSYCYVPKSNEAMDLPTGRRAIDAIFASARRHGYSRVLIKYAGGEATLNFGLVRQLHIYALECAEVSNIELYEAVLSNGIALSPAMLAYLREAGIQLMISLDGWAEGHDLQRRFVNGKGSFRQVVRGIERAVTMGLDPNLSMVVSADSAPYLADGVRFALKHGLRFNLSFYRETEYASSEAQAMHEQIIEGMRCAFAEIATALPQRRLIDGLVDRATFDAPSQSVCGAGESFMAIDHRGNIARCQMELQRPVSHIREFDPLLTIRLDTVGFQNPSLSDKEGCRSCIWRNWCAGGCPALTFHTTGRSNVRSPYCEVYTTLYPEVVRLEGLRLVKWAATGKCVGIERWL